MSDRITLVTSWVYKQDGSKPREMADMEGVREVVNRLEFLEAENESLRKDAERYRRMRAMTLAQTDDAPDEFDSAFDSQLNAAPAHGDQS